MNAGPQELPGVEPRAREARTPPGSSPEPEIDYRASWRAYALRRSLALFLAGAWVPISLGLFVYSRFGWHEPILALAIMLVWLLPALAAVWWAGEFRCPRCRRRYGALGNKKGDTNYTRGLFDKVCANCKLRKFELG